MINVAIIGTGNIAPSHIEGYAAFKDRCKIAALVDIYPEKAQAIKEKYHLDADVYDSHEKLFERDDIHLISICTPPYTHAQISIDCMNHGLDVLCEKPMAASLAECDAMIDARDKTGQRLSIISQNRFRSPIMKLKNLLDQKVAGRVLHAQVDSVWWRGHSYYDLWWRGTWEKEGGGCTLNHAVHHIDMLNWMKGLPVEITAIVNNLNHDNAEVEDFSVAISKYEDGSMSTMMSSLVHHGEEQQFIFQCEQAKICAPWSVAAFKSRPNGFGEPYPEKQKEIEDYYRTLEDLEYEGHAGQIDNVIRSIENGHKNFLVQAEDGRRTLEYITAVYKSGFSSQKVCLPLEKDDPFYTVEGIQANVEKFYEKTGSVENFDPEFITTGNDYSKYNYDK
ncbi:Gfo/Idh/MocA family protein [Cellulosilyticum sp. I15G10I2]|uniref:Gfo/Idh/MocA family protein n=1 Tax=Cellulosilyticum sp. I15G10I2 TaxID=1892843 RepID=UPI00085C780F|nr:Gfo/Idh/MocA family oxidoreductase [Cellulosilyticum sp. I15G10I2]